MKKCLEEANKIIKNTPYIFRIKYHIIGRMLLWEVIQKLKKTGWDYLHMPSKCVERDSKGFKYKNNRLISNEDYDKKYKKINYSLFQYTIPLRDFLNGLDP